jgi:hypothetical protein
VIRKSSIQLYIVGGLVIATAAVGGCELVASVDRTRIGATGGASPTGGMGGIGAQGGGGDPQGGGGIGGGGGPVCVPAECPGDTDCQNPACMDDMCIVENETMGATCDDGVSTEAQFCDDAGGCTWECQASTDCPPPGGDPEHTLCDVPNHDCVNELCDNGALDPGNGETDVDCGGTNCAACVNGETCAVDDDCQSNFCNGTTCEACDAHADCEVGEHCDLNATDACVPDVADGLPCPDYGNDQCSSGFCVNEGASGMVCCDEACGGTCRACVAAKTAGTDGVCDLIPAMTDPDAECAQSDASCTGNNCDGASANCQPRPSGTDCRVAANQCDALEECTGVAGQGCPPDANLPNMTPCTDGTFCNGTETCTNGSCGGSSGNPCAGHNVGPNCSDSCNEGADNCTANDMNGTACPNANFCDGAETCNNGNCIDNTDPCPGHNVGPNCNDSCNEAADLCNAADTNGTPCPDSLFCDGAETCSGGSCVDNADPCPGDDVGPSCDDSCDEAADDCLLADAMGTACDEIPGGAAGTCSGNLTEPNCAGDN